jgi:hypothetical protein
MVYNLGHSNLLVAIVVVSSLTSGLETVGLVSGPHLTNSIAEIGWGGTLYAMAATLIT